MDLLSVVHVSHLKFPLAPLKLVSALYVGTAVAAVAA